MKLSDKIKFRTKRSFRIFSYSENSMNAALLWLIDRTQVVCSFECLVEPRCRDLSATTRELTATLIRLRRAQHAVSPRQSVVHCVDLMSHTARLTYSQPILIGDRWFHSLYPTLQYRAHYALFDGLQLQPLCSLRTFQLAGRHNGRQKAQRRVQSDVTELNWTDAV